MGVLKQQPQQRCHCRPVCPNLLPAEAQGADGTTGDHGPGRRDAPTHGEMQLRDEFPTEGEGEAGHLATTPTTSEELQVLS